MTTADIDRLAKGYTCKCGAFNRYPSYVYAHWATVLRHTCGCGREYDVLRGKAVEKQTRKRKL